MKNVFLNNKKFASLLLLGCVSLFVVSCNKDFENTLQDEFGKDSSSLNLGTRKVLMVILDGAVGSEVRAIAPKNLTLLSDFSIYSYDALADFKGAEPMSEQRGWTNILTGVNPQKHGVTDDSFSANHIDDYPTIFTRLQNEHPDWETVAYATSPAFIDELAKDANKKDVFSSDAEAKDAAINTLKADEEVSLLTVQLEDIDKAGKEGSYSAGDPGYKSAVIKADEYLGEMIAAMRSRKNFNAENWLVVVVSSNGAATTADPAAASQNAYNDARRNTLLFIYNPRFKSQSGTKPGSIIPYIGTSPLFNGKKNGSMAEVLDDDHLFDFGDKGSFTIQCKVKIKAGNYYYPAILGKREKWAAGHPGWVFFLEGDFWMINFGQEGQGNQQIRGQAVSDDKWHTLTAVIRQEGNQRMVSTYTDGVPGPAPINIAGKGNINTDRPLMVGHFDEDGGSGPDNFFVTDIRIYNEALDADYIAANYCSVDISEDDPYRENLLGFWPGTRVTGSKQLPDLSGNNKPFQIDELNAVSFSDMSNKVCPAIKEEVYRTVPNSVDIASQIYLWYGVQIAQDWKLDGKNWIPEFTDLSN